MLMRCLVAGVCALCFVPDTKAAAPESLTIQNLTRGQQFEVQTDKRYFQFTVIDPTTGELTGRISEDGQEFGETATVYLLGATLGTQPGDGGITLVQMNEIKVGMSMELGVFDLAHKNRWITPRVRGFAVLPNFNRVSILSASD